MIHRKIHVKKVIIFYRIKLIRTKNESFLKKLDCTNKVTSSIIKQNGTSIIKITSSPIPLKRQIINSNINFDSMNTKSDVKNIMNNSSETKITNFIEDLQTKFKNKI